MQKLNYYQVFEVSPAASQKEITQAYRRLARQCHPDLMPLEQKGWAEEQMKRLNEAYAVLGDPEARRRYTSAILCHMGAGSFSGSWAASPSEGWFRGAPRRKARRKRSEKWIKVATLLDFVLWMLIIDFLVIGAVLMAVNWNGVAEAFNSGQWAGLQCLLMGLWWVLLMAALFKMVPMRR